MSPVAMVAAPMPVTIRAMSSDMKLPASALHTPPSRPWRDRPRRSVAARSDCRSAPEERRDRQGDVEAGDDSLQLGRVAAEFPREVGKRNRNPVKLMGITKVPNSTTGSSSRDGDRWSVVACGVGDRAPPGYDGCRTYAKESTSRRCDASQT